MFLIILESNQEFPGDHTYGNTNNNVRLTLDWSSPDVTTGRNSILLILLKCDNDAFIIVRGFFLFKQPC